MRNTALHLAAKKGHAGARTPPSRSFLSHGSIGRASPHLRLTHGYMFAHPGVVESLLHNGASATAINSDRQGLLRLEGCWDTTPQGNISF